MLLAGMHDAAAGGAGPSRGLARPGASVGPMPVAETTEGVRPAVAAPVAKLRASPEAQRLALLRQLVPQAPNPLSAAELIEVAASFPEGARLDALNAVLPAVPARLEAAELGRLAAGLPDRDRHAALRLLVLRVERVGPVEAAALLGPLRDQQRLDGLGAVLARMPTPSKLAFGLQRPRAARARRENPSAPAGVERNGSDFVS